MARATTILQQRQRCLDCKDPAHQQQQHHHNEGNNPSLTTAKMQDACALMMATTPLLQGQQRQLDDYASLTATEMPSQCRQQSPLRQW
jgi:hypothetical protein